MRSEALGAAQPTREAEDAATSALQPYVDLIEAGDPAVFTIESQTGIADRKSLLVIQNVVRGASPHYAYLEIGSHLGGTLVPHLVDPRCQRVFSVDKRPPAQLDERGVFFDYPDNSTKNMVDGLRRSLPSVALDKLYTYDVDAEELASTDIDVLIDLALIDGEHTNVAVFRDFLNLKKFLANDCIVAFDDGDLICDGLQNIEAFLRHTGIDFLSFFLPNRIVAIAAGRLAQAAEAALKPLSLDREQFISASRLARWRVIASNLGLIKADVIGHRLA